MYGDMQNVSAQIIENMHVPLKDTAARSNGQAGWELQTMTRSMCHGSSDQFGGLKYGISQA